MRRAPVLAVAASLATGLLIYAYLGRLAGPQVNVVLAARDLPAGTRIAPEDVRVAALPGQAVHGRAADPAAVVGRYLLADLVADQMILEPQLAPSGSPGPVAVRLRDGHVAFFLPLSLSRGLGGAVRPGDRINVVFVPRGREQGSAFVLVEGARVLELRAEDGTIYRDPGDARQVPLGLLLEVRPAEAVSLAHALENGSLYAVLPGPAAATSPLPEGPGRLTGGEPGVSAGGEESGP